jgi:hypothetical protein
MVADDGADNLIVLCADDARDDDVALVRAKGLSTALRAKTNMPS